MTRERPLVVLYWGHSLYDSLNTMTTELASAIERQGYRAVIVDLRQGDASERLRSLVQSGPVARFVSVNGLGLPARPEDCRWYQEAAVPIVFYGLDHPAGLYPTLQLPLPTLVATVPTPHNVDFCQAFLSPTLRCRHLPHAAARVAARLQPWRLRDVPLLLSASLQQRPDAARADWGGYGRRIAGNLNAMIEAHEAEPARPLDRVITSVLESTLPGVHELFSYFSVLDTYLRNRLRERLVAACRTLPLTVCGGGWTADPSGPRQFLGVRPVQEIFALMARSKIVLNPLPPYYQSHERPFQAMARGAAAATSPMPWFTTGEGQDRVLTLADDVEEQVARIVAAAADDAALEALAQAGHEAFLAGHTWDHRARTLLSL